MKRVLEPIDRVSEVIFGVLMAMTFIGALSVGSERLEVRTALAAALGCNLAWGLADAVMYVVGTLTERTREGGKLAFDDYRGAFGVFLLVALSTFPLVIPFLFFDRLAPALLASRIVALAMLFGGGWMLARYAGGKPWRWGCGLAAVGAVLLAAITALGG